MRRSLSLPAGSFRPHRFWSVICLLVFLSAPAFAQARSTTETRFEVTQFVGGLLLVAVLIGVFFNLWKTTKVYGGIIGQGLRRIGIGIVFLAIEAIDRVAENFSGYGIVAGLVGRDYNIFTHDFILLLGLFFISMGFVKFSSVLKS
ncbi:MAG: hypothetical protein HY397_02510 [Candidatus Doudnabacteria bacterium]|nr:hypothetical protein [Candidatus Doudnabacteria bacterium]